MQRHFHLDEFFTAVFPLSSLQLRTNYVQRISKMQLRLACCFTIELIPSKGVYLLHNTMEKKLIK